LPYESSTSTCLIFCLPIYDPLSNYMSNSLSACLLAFLHEPVCESNILYTYTLSSNFLTSFPIQLSICLSNLLFVHLYDTLYALCSSLCLDHQLYATLILLLSVFLIIYNLSNHL
jgi:hypothetical protein